MSKTDVSYGVWSWTTNGEVRCSKCNSIIGVAFCDEAYKELSAEDKFCYNCGSPMLPLTFIEKVAITNPK